jgi:hypothetical protein
LIVLAGNYDGKVFEVRSQRASHVEKLRLKLRRVRLRVLLLVPAMVLPAHRLAGTRLRLASPVIRLHEPLAQILADYNGRLLGSESGLVLYLPLDENVMDALDHSASATDYSLSPTSAATFATGSQPAGTSVSPLAACPV